MKNVARLTLFFSACLTIAPGIVSANVVFNDGAVHVVDDAAYADENVYVYNAGCAGSNCPEPGAPTEVVVAAGAEVLDVSVYQTSLLTVSGGEITDTAFGFQSSTIILTGTGLIDDMRAQEEGFLVMNSATASCRIMRGTGSGVSLQVSAGEISTRLYAWGTRVWS